MPRNVRYSSNSGTKADIVLDPVCANQPPTPLDSHAPREPMRIITEVRRQPCHRAAGKSWRSPELF
jgi:hypothetical protein